jgi:pimeloyl-ACP methyl ester carboxylesterase
VLTHLPASVRAFALTQRGHGDADRPAGGYRTRDFAADVATFLEAVGTGPAVVVGHSMGSTNALRFAIDYPELARGLVLLGAFATYQGNPGLVEFWESAVSRLSDPVDWAFARAFQESTLARPIPNDFLATAVRESLKLPARVWRAAFAGLFEDDFVADVSRVRAPTLLVWGDRDGLCPRADQDAFLTAIPGSRLTVYEGAGHAVHWEEPARFAADLVRFCQSVH